MADKPKKDPPKRVAADITDILEEILTYPERSDDVDPEAWEMLTDAQKLVFLAKKRLGQVRGSQSNKAGDADGSNS